MLNDHIEILLAKYCANQLTAEESEALNVWVALDDNKVVFEKYIRLNFSIEQSKTPDLRSKNESWRYIEAQITHTSWRKNYWKIGIAASLAILLGLSYFLTQDDISYTTPLVENNDIEVGTDKAVLTLEDGVEVVLEKGNDYRSENIESDGETVIYKATNKGSNTAKIAYNYLTIPRGGQFYIELSDDTKVWLNSESKIKYPKAFLKNTDRVVELIYGEAYFDVSPSVNHQGSKFKVISNNQEVEVLGTEFNIKAYKDEDRVLTTLVEGKVTVSNDKLKTELEPNNQSQFNRLTNEIKVVSIDVDDEISWKNGLFSFKNKSFREIMIVLSRWYDVDFVFENEKLADITFNGVFNKKLSLEEVLAVIENSKTATFEIKEKTIYMK